jgi:hypothetical protein
MPTELQTRTGSCPEHGVVQATREVPASGFPWVVSAVRRWIAKRRSYRCPTCGNPVTS